MLDLIHYSQRARDTLEKLKQFMQEHVYPVEAVSSCYSLNRYIESVMMYKGAQHPPITDHTKSNVLLAIIMQHYVSQGQSFL